MKRILIFGSSNYNRTDLNKILRILTVLNNKEHIIVHTNNKGSATIVNTLANIMKFKMEVYKLEEQKYGRFAELKRDLDILFSGLNTIYLLDTDILEKNRMHLIDRAKSLNIPIVTV